MNLKKSLRVGSLMAGYLADAAFLTWYHRQDRTKRLRSLAKNVSHYSRRGLQAMNVDVDVHGLDAVERSGRNHLIVCNHMSYLDILILASIRPSLFVTSVDMGEKAFLGKMIESGGCILIERRHRERVEFDKSAIVEALREGHDVVLFPEGTSSDGTQILPFKKSLLTAASAAGVDILPVALKYREINGQAFGPLNHHKVCWYGDMDFLPHILGVTELSQVKVDLHFLSPVRAPASATREDLATTSRSAIEATYMASTATL